MVAIPTLWREKPTDDWRECELIGRHRSGDLVLRELDKHYPGVWLAPADAVHVPASQVLLPLKAT